jgi:hypothetical protein
MSELVDCPFINDGWKSVADVLTEPMTAMEVVEETGVSKGNVCRILDGLEGVGVVEVYDQTFTEPDATRRSRRWIRTTDAVTVDFDGETELPEESGPVWDR